MAYVHCVYSAPAAAKTSPLALEPLAPQRRQEIQDRGKEVHTYREQRAQWESEGPKTTPPGLASP